MMLLACAGAAEKMPSHDLHRKTLKLVAVLSVCVKRFSLQAKVAPSNRNILTQIVRRALNAISDRIKLKLNLLCDFKGNRKIASKIDPVALYKHRTMIIFLEFPVRSD